MKKVYSTFMLLAMMVAALGLISCGGDDGDESTGGDTSRLVGTWEDSS